LASFAAPPVARRGRTIGAAGTAEDVAKEKRELYRRVSQAGAEPRRGKKRVEAAE